MSIKNKLNRLIFLPCTIYNIVTLKTAGEFQIRLREAEKKSIPERPAPSKTDN